MPRWTARYRWSVQRHRLLRAAHYSPAEIECTVVVSVVTVYRKPIASTNRAEERSPNVPSHEERHSNRRRFVGGSADNSVVVASICHIGLHRAGACGNKYLPRLVVVDLERYDSSVLRFRGNALRNESANRGHMGHQKQKEE